MLDLVERTWAELGFRIQAPRFLVWVRTLPVEQKRGLIWLPPKMASFYGELPHLRTVRAVVLSAGPRGLAKSLKPGDVIAFSRGVFSRFFQMQPTQVTASGASEEFVGVIDSNDIFGFSDEYAESEAAHVEHSINEVEVLASADGGC
jgi:hypothetical protein